MTKQLSSSTYGGVPRPLGADQLTKVQTEAVAYFFFRIKTIDPQQYDVLMPDESTERAIKREFAPYLINKTKEQIDKGLAAYHQELMAGNRDYRFMKLDLIIGLVENGGNAHGNQSGAHKDFYERDANGVAIRLPEPEYQRLKHKEKGTKALGGILNMFNGGE